MIFCENGHLTGSLKGHSHVAILTILNSCVLKNIKYKNNFKLFERLEMDKIVQ